MCDFFGGDLADIVRASTGTVPTTTPPPNTTTSDSSWHQYSLSLPPPPPPPPVTFLPPPPPQLSILELPAVASVGGGGGGGLGNSLFSRVLQISPTKMMPSGNDQLQRHNQISSPRPPPPLSNNISGIKRRKSLAKKVVCIPAPAAANNRSSGEVVPSDLWAWRKYGQKPIKGSPYPRGYYRCSSSKGCSARKQVERSRTDPNMLVITYTSEHNHPWPTQRNALAGSTRSQPSKNTTTSSSKTPKTTIKEEPTINVKEELAHVEDMFFEDQTSTDDFFADLSELEHDPMNVMFKNDEDHELENKERNEALDSFIDMFDWGGSSYGGDQGNKGL